MLVASAKACLRVNRGITDATDDRRPLFRLFHQSGRLILADQDDIFDHLMDWGRVIMMPILSPKSRFVQIIAVLAVIITPGCAKNRQKVMVSNNRPIIEGASSVGGSEIVVNQPASNGSRFIDRHPLFYKPGEYYTTYDGNVVVRGARATFVGIPAGVVGEVKQAFRGVPKRIVVQ